jgi:hypothetical protein
VLEEEIDYNPDLFLDAFLKHMQEYYDFANRYKFDIVVGFDLGGKYTFKDGECRNQRLIDFYEALDKDAINIAILEESIRYLKNNPEFYPKFLATVHGRTPEKYADYTRKALLLEEKYAYKYWGFALGGIASSRNIDSSWYDHIDFSVTNKKPVKDTVAPAKAIKIVRNIIGKRPIHALGCGGYPNIPMNYYNGATSFDAASPARRVGEGNKLSAKYVFSLNPPKKVGTKAVSFSKLFIGGFCSDLTILDGNPDYIALNLAGEGIPLCGCNACQQIKSVIEIKSMYHEKVNGDEEQFYFARQLLNAHAVWQHTYLCEIVAKYTGTNQLKNAFPANLLFEKLDIINRQL